MKHAIVAAGLLWFAFSSVAQAQYVRRYHVPFPDYHWQPSCDDFYDNDAEHLAWMRQNSEILRQQLESQRLRWAIRDVKHGQMEPWNRPGHGRWRMPRP